MWPKIFYEKDFFIWGAFLGGGLRVRGVGGGAAPTAGPGVTGPASRTRPWSCFHGSPGGSFPWMKLCPALRCPGHGVILCWWKPQRRLHLHLSSPDFGFLAGHQTHSPVLWGRAVLEALDRITRELCTDTDSIHTGSVYLVQGGGYAWVPLKCPKCIHGRT